MRLLGPCVCLCVSVRVLPDLFESSDIVQFEVWIQVADSVGLHWRLVRSEAPLRGVAGPGQSAVRSLSDCLELGGWTVHLQHNEHIASAAQ